MSSDTSLFENYRRTTFRVMGIQPSIDIRIDQPCPDLDALLDRHASRCWAFITAWNPGSKKLDTSENRRRQRALEADAKEGGYIFYRGAGVPDETGWEPEESILIVGINRKEAVKLGVKCGQAAIVAGELGAPAELVFIY